MGFGKLGARGGFGSAGLLGRASGSSWPSGTWPGQTGNVVGHTAAPGYSALSAWPGGTGAKTITDGTNATSGSGTVGDPWIFAFRDFDSLTGGVTVAIGDTKYATFKGCRFQSNQSGNFNVQTNSGNITFSYCSVTPRVALNAAPPNAAWPSSSAGVGISYDSGAYSNYVIPHANGYQYGINIVGTGAPVTIDHCDIWGFANGVTFPTSGTQQLTVTANWIHDPRNDGGAIDHTDGVGYLNGGAQPSNILIQGNTIAAPSNTNMVAMQGGTGTPTNVKVIGNFISGGTLACMLEGVTQVTDNVFATDLPWHNGPLYRDYSSQFTTTLVWQRNTFSVLAGTVPYAAAFSWTSGQNGYYLWPDISLHATDWAPVAAYSGPGNVVSGAKLWVGLRGYNAAYATGSNPCLDIVRASDSAVQTFNILSTGAVDVAGITTFLTATTGKCSKLYDQTGNANHLVQTTDANRPAVTLSASGLGSNQPCLTFAGGQYLQTTGSLAAQAQPWTMKAFAKRTGNLTSQQFIIDTLDSGVNDLAIMFWTGPEVILKAPSTVGGDTCADNAWHSIVGVGNGSSGIIGIDGTSTTGLSAGTTGPDGTHAVAVGAQIGGGTPITGTLSEAGFWPSAFSTTQITNMNTNDQYWFAAKP